MDNENTNNQEEPIVPPSLPSIQKVIGIILLLPPLLSVPLFIFQLIGGSGEISGMRNLGSNWTVNYSSEGGGFTSAAPIYLGLMAIAGVLLIKNDK